MPGKVEICGVNTARLKVLSQKEMESLLIKARDGDETARENLIEGNLRLVLSVIQRFSGRGESPDDLFQVGCIGLIKAISNFDPDKQVRFSTYGVPMIIECRECMICADVPRKTRGTPLFLFLIFNQIIAQSEVNINYSVFMYYDRINEFTAHILLLFLCHVIPCIFQCAENILCFFNLPFNFDLFFFVFKGISQSCNSEFAVCDLFF